MRATGAGSGYCVSQELQAHSQSCGASASKSKQCFPKELCFHEARQRWRHLKEDPESGMQENGTLLEDSPLENIELTLGIAAEGEDPLGRHLAADGLQSARGICVGIRSA